MDNPTIKALDASKKLVSSMFSQVLDRLDTVREDSLKIAKEAAVDFAESADPADRAMYKTLMARANMPSELARAMLSDPLLDSEIKSRIVRSYPELDLPKAKPPEQFYAPAPIVPNVPAPAPKPVAPVAPPATVAPPEPVEETPVVEAPAKTTTIVVQTPLVGGGDLPRIGEAPTAVKVPGPFDIAPKPNSPFNR